MPLRGTQWATNCGALRFVNSALTSALTMGLLIVVLAATVHGDERTFREGLLVLMRDFATPGTEAYELLDDVTVVVAPEINPDGSEASVLGTRGNAPGASTSTATT